MDRLINIGKIAPKHSSKIKNSKIGIGFEKLDRGVFDPEKAYDKVADLGVKWVRIQSGWARTEKAKGVYDFKWLDLIVDNLLARGLKPWICLCYGNGLYDEAAKKIFGAVGCPPIHTDEAKQAWLKYVKTLVRHFEGKVEYYEIWNEPDGIWCWKHGVNATEYGLFAVETAKAIRQGDLSAKIVGGAICLNELAYLNEALCTGMADCIDALSFHEYTPDESHVFEKVNAFRALCHMYNPKIEIIQGESGSQSRRGGAGALQSGAWTEKKQAKQLARHSIADLLSGVKFTSYFSTLDMIEALNGTVDNKASYLDYGYFGVLAADFDDQGYSTGEYSPKLSYWSLQTISSLFAEDFEIVDLPIMLKEEESPLIFGRDCHDSTIIKGGFKRANGACAFAYWNSLDLMTTEFESTVTIEIAAVKGTLRLIDLLDGKIYEIPENMIEKNEDSYTLKNIPIKDYPLVLTFGDF